MPGPTINDWEYHYNGLTFGGATAYGIKKVDGLSPPDVRVEESAKAEDHGSFVFASYVGPRTVVFEGDILAEHLVASNPASMSARLDALRKAFAPQTSDQGLYIKWPHDARRVLWCRPKRLHFPKDIDFNLGIANWAAEFIAGDPRMYDDATVSVVVAPGAWTTITHNGTFPTPPELVFTVPAGDTAMVDPFVDGSGDVFFRVNTTVNPGSTLRVNMKNKTILLDGVNVYGSLHRNSKWFDLPVGNLDLLFRRTSGGTNATMTVQYSVARI